MYCSVCISSVFSKLTLPDAIRAAKQAGAGACECWICPDEAIPEMRRALDETGLKMTAIVISFFTMNDAAQRDTYIAALKKAIAQCKALSCPAIITQVGQDRPDVPHAEQHRLILETLKECAPILEAEGITLLVEPLNALVDHIGYFLTASQEGAQLVREAASPNIRLLFDIYHQQITEGNLIVHLRTCMDVTAHIHAAGVPGRHEPSVDSEINYPAILKALKQMDYEGAIGLEYFPTYEAETSLKDQFRYLAL